MDLFETFTLSPTPSGDTFPLLSPSSSVGYGGVKRHHSDALKGHLFYVRCPPSVRVLQNYRSTDNQHPIGRSFPSLSFQGTPVGLLSFGYGSLSQCVSRKDSFGTTGYFRLSSTVRDYLNYGTLSDRSYCRQESGVPSVCPLSCGCRRLFSRSSLLLRSVRVKGLEGRRS